LPLAATEKVALLPAVTVWLDGWVVIEGAVGAAVHVAVELQSPVPEGIVAGRTGLHALRVWLFGGFVGVGNVGIAPPTATDRRIAVMLPEAGAWRTQSLGAVKPQFAFVPAWRTTLRVVVGVV